MKASGIVATPIEPRIEFNAFEYLGSYGISSEPWIIDFAEYKVPVTILRTMLLLGFIFGIFSLTKKAIWTGGG